MNTKELVYQGNAHIYLQGKNALQPVDTSSTEFHTYYVGAEGSSILVRDLRQGPIQAAKAALENNDDGTFADVFNQPAEVEVYMFTENETIEMIIHPGVEDGHFPVLWFGVIDGQKMPMFDVEWEVLRPINMEVLAFVSLVKADSFNTGRTPGTTVTKAETLYSFG